MIQMVCQSEEDSFISTSPAKLIDLKAPSDFAKSITQPEPVNEDIVNEWCFVNITQPQFESTKERIDADIKQRKIYLDEAFNNIIFDLTNEINELQPEKNQSKNTPGREQNSFPSNGPVRTGVGEWLQLESTLLARQTRCERLYWQLPVIRVKREASCGRSREHLRNKYWCEKGNQR
jgi:hypothetical protein